MAEKRSVYLSDRALGLPRRGDSLSGRLNQVADRYTELVRRECDAVRSIFTAAEWRALLDACGAWRADPASTIPGGAALAVADAARSGACPETVAPELLSKLRQLRPLEDLVLIELIEARAD